ncbi:MAG: hypothetical protein O2900_14645 [Proteobacteria bacterium]|nr:hypothetical protein [Pseudomonadota bacterium]
MNLSRHASTGATKTLLGAITFSRQHCDDKSCEKYVPEAKLSGVGA